MINGDLSLGLSLAMDVTALWLTGTLGRRPIRVWSIVAAAILGTLPTLVALITFSRWLNLADLTLTPWVMVGVAYRPVHRREWITLGGTLYGVTIALGGVSLALVGAGLPLAVSLALVPAGGLLIARWWARTVSRPLRERRGRVELRLSRSGRTMTLEALWDSGNRLYTPAGVPVIVVADDVVRPLFGGEGPPRADANVVRAATVAGSMRLPIVEVDGAEVEVNGEWMALKPVVIGISPSWHGRNSGIGALVNPDWLHESASRYA